MQFPSHLRPPPTLSKASLYWLENIFHHWFNFQFLMTENCCCRILYRDWNRRWRCYQGAERKFIFVHQFLLTLFAFSGPSNFFFFIYFFLFIRQKRSNNKCLFLTRKQQIVIGSKCPVAIFMLYRDGYKKGNQIVQN